MRYEPPSDCDLVDYGDATVLPGLIDTHVHLVGDSRVMALERLAEYSPEEIDAVVIESLRRQLAAGVTTVRDLGIVRHRPQPPGVGVIQYACDLIGIDLVALLEVVCGRDRLAAADVRFCGVRRKRHRGSLIGGPTPDEHSDDVELLRCRTGWALVLQCRKCRTPRSHRQRGLDAALR